MSGKPRVWTAREIALARHYAADPEKTRDDLIREVRCSNNSISKLLKVAGVTKWERLAPNKRCLTEAELKQLRQYAADPAVSLTQVGEKMSATTEAVKRWLNEAGIEWKYNKWKPSTLTLEQIQPYADSTEYSVADAAKALRVPASTLTGRLQRLGIRWTEKTGSRTSHAKVIDVDLLRRLAQDRTVGQPEAAKRLGIHESTMKRHLERHGIKWVSGRKPAAIVVRPADPPRDGPKDNTRMMPAPKVDLPAFTMRPEKIGGRPGFRWQCHFLGQSGWRAGTRDQAEKEIQRVIALAVSRHSTMIGRAA